MAIVGPDGTIVRRLASGVPGKNDANCAVKLVGTRGGAPDRLLVPKLCLGTP